MLTKFLKKMKKKKSPCLILPKELEGKSNFLGKKPNIAFGFWQLLNTHVWWQLTISKTFKIIFGSGYFDRKFKKYIYREEM